MLVTIEQWLGCSFGLYLDWFWLPNSRPIAYVLISFGPLQEGIDNEVERTMDFSWQSQFRDAPL
jgi:hypothetical protein